jgi:cytochrome P450 family 4
MIEVAKQPHIFDKIKTEINSIVDKDIEHITKQDLSKMVYLDQVIKEGMRLWPVTAMGSIRQNSKDIKFQDMIIPKGSTININQYAIFRMGIQDPESFNPERWSPGSPDLEQLKVSFLPFAFGRRNCIGQNLAIFEAKLILATLFRSFKFELQTVVAKAFTLTLKPINAFLKVISV